MSPHDPFADGVIAAMPGLKAFAMSLCRDEHRAEDLVSDTVLRALENRHQFEPGTKLDAWLFTILRNSFLSNRRKRRREVEDADGEIAARLAIEDSPLRKLEAAELLRLVEKMPKQFRVVLRALADGASYDEVAFETREHIGTIKSRANRGRTMLRAAT